MAPARVSKTSPMDNVISKPNRNPVRAKKYGEHVILQSSMDVRTAAFCPRRVYLTNPLCTNPRQNTGGLPVNLTICLPPTLIFFAFRLPSPFAFRLALPVAYRLPSPFAFRRPSPFAFQLASPLAFHAPSPFAFRQPWSMCLPATLSLCLHLPSPSASRLPSPFAFNPPSPFAF